MINKNLSKIIIYLSLIFLVIYLYKNGYIIVLSIENYTLFVLSIGFLIGGFFFQATAWYVALHTHDNNITKSLAFVSEFTSIFAKYIPGKVMMILGPSSYISAHSRISLKDTSFYSLQVQILNLWLGLMIGSLVFFYAELSKEWLYIIIIGELLFTIFLFSNIFHNLFLKLVNILFKKIIKIPDFNNQLIKNILPYIFLRWLFWAIAFSLFVSSVVNVEFDFLYGLGFILAGVLGVMALLAPGGVGVREGILVVILSLLGLSVELATSISITSRLWFIIGEVMMFCLGMILKHKMVVKV